MEPIKARATFKNCSVFILDTLIECLHQVLLMLLFHCFIKLFHSELYNAISRSTRQHSI